MGKKKWEAVIISNTDNIPGKKIIKTIDNIKIKHDATNFQKHARWAFNAQNKLRKIAYKLGANAIINARFNYRGDYNHYDGTAVIVKDED